MRLHHLIGEVDRAKARGLSANQGATPGQPLAGEDPRFVLRGQAAVLAKEEPDLAATDADVTGWHVAVFANVAVQLRHKGLAKAHDLYLGLALGIKVRTALAAANGQAGQGVFEDLLKAEELDDAQVDRGVESEASFVGAERGVELNAEAAVDLDFAIIVDPWHTEDELAFRLAQALHQAVVRVLRVFF